MWLYKEYSIKILRKQREMSVIKRADLGLLFQIIVLVFFLKFLFYQICLYVTGMNITNNLRSGN